MCKALSFFTFGLLGGGIFNQFREEKKARKASERAARAEQRRADLESARQRRQVFREAQAARARIAAAGASQGALESSAIRRGQAAVTGQENFNIRFLNTTQQLNRDRVNALVDQQKHQLNAQQLGSLVNIGTSIATGGFGGG